MPEHQQTQQSTESKTTFQKQATPASPTSVSNPYSIIQRAKINPKSLTHADIMQLQRTIGNRAVGMLLSSIKSSSTSQQATVQRQEVPEEEESLQGKMTETVQRQEVPEEEEEPIQGKMIGAIQCQEIPEKEEPLQGMFGKEPEDEKTCPSCMQRQEVPEEEELLQGKIIEPVQRQEIPEEEEPHQTKTEHNTGMPNNLKAGVESLSGIDMSDVRVYYNSSKPAEVGALAYTQGTDIHVAPGQERHLPHEAWHVVQQAQGRVKPTFQMKGMAVNDEEGLEHEADVMGTKALQINPTEDKTRAVFKTIPQNKISSIQGFGFKANRSEAPLQNGLQAMNSVTQNVIQLISRVADGTQTIKMGYWGYRTMADGDSIETHAITTCVAVVAYTNDAAHAIVAHFGDLTAGETIQDVQTEVRAGITEIKSKMDEIAAGGWSVYVFTGVERHQVSEARIHEIIACIPSIKQVDPYSGVKLTRRGSQIIIVYDPVKTPKRVRAGSFS